MPDNNTVWSDDASDDMDDGSGTMPMSVPVKSPANKKSARGFASMDDRKQRQIASKGGKAAHASGNAHEWNSQEARAAGRKGGEAVSQDKAHMSEIGRRGGQQ